MTSCISGKRQHLTQGGDLPHGIQCPGDAHLSGSNDPGGKVPYIDCLSRGPEWARCDHRLPSTNGKPCGPVPEAVTPVAGASDEARPADVDGVASNNATGQLARGLRRTEGFRARGLRVGQWGKSRCRFIRARRVLVGVDRTLVLGLGNEYAGDDAVGVLAVRALPRDLAGGADVVESAASGLALLEVFAGYDRAVVVDSIQTGRSPAGTIIETGLAELGVATAPSLHQAGIPELAAVARRLGMRFPDRTRVLAVEVSGPLTFGAPLSEPVAAAVTPLSRRVLEQVQRWASENSGPGLPQGAGRGPEDTLPPGPGGARRTTTTRSARS